MRAVKFGWARAKSRYRQLGRDVWAAVEMNLGNSASWVVRRAACARWERASERADTGRSKARPCVGGAGAGAGAGAGLGFGFRAGALAVSTIFLRRARRRWKIRQDRKGCQALAVAAQRQHKTGDGVTADVGLCLLSVGDGCAVCSRRYE
jgi:hypothetical protein